MNNRLPILIAASVSMAAASVCAHEVANGDCAVVFHVDADGVDASFDRNPKAYSMTKSIVASSDALSLDAGRTTLLSWVDRNRGAICENYNPLTGDVVGWPSFGWSAVFTIKFIDDWGVSRDVEMPAK